MKIAGAIAVALLTGCTSFGSVSPNECGNRVLELGEDCDGASAFGGDTTCAAPDEPNECFYICDADAKCPEGWGCGTDGRCRQASGEFVLGEGSPWRFSVDNFGIGDVDGDGNADLIGNDVQNITVRYGSTDGTFVQELEFLTRTPTGPPALGKFNDDDLTDIVVPIDLGLFVLLGNAARTLDPVAYAPFDLGALRPKLAAITANLFDISTQLLILDEVTDTMWMLGNQNLADAVSLPAGSVAALLGPIPRANLGGLSVQAGRQEWAIAVPGTRSVTVWEMVGATPATARASLLRTVSVPGPIHLGAAFGDVDGDGDADLLVSYRDDVTSRSQIAVAVNSFGNVASTAVHLSAFDRQTDGAIPWPLAVGDFTGDGKLDYVMRDVVLIATGGVALPTTPADLFPTTFPASGQWKDATVGDFNGDGRQDFAASTDGLEGIDVYLSNGGVFSRFHLDTRNPPRQLHAGDYDGDFVSDVAFVSEGQLEGERDELQVLFGQQSGGPTAPIAMGQFDGIDSLDPVAGVGFVTADLSSDLIVLSSNAEGQRALAFMEGSSSRRMISPFTLDDPATGAQVPTGAVFGDFIGGDGFTDIIAVAQPEKDGNFDEGVPGAATLTPTVWAVPGADGVGGLNAAGVAFQELPVEAQFSLRCSRWVSGDIDLEGPDELIGIDKATECAGATGSPSPQAVVVSGTTNGAPIDLASSGFLAPDSSMLSDLDRDGRPDLIVLFVGEFRASNDASEEITGSGISVFWNVDGAIEFQTGVDKIQVPDFSRLLAVTALRLDDDLFNDLLILTDAGLYRSMFDPETRKFSEPEWFMFQPGSRLLASGDLNGDGLDDFAYVYGAELEVRLALPAPPLGTQSASAEVAP